MPPRVVIVILNWNGWADTAECLESVMRCSFQDFAIVLVDNGSVDGSVEKLRGFAGGRAGMEGAGQFTRFVEMTRQDSEQGGPFEELPPRSLVLIKNEKNFGFAEGNNIAIRFSLTSIGPDFVLLLNNDTTVDPAFLGELVSSAVSLPRAAVVGPVIYYYSEPHRINFSGEDVVVWKGDGYRYTDPISQPRSVNKIDGACALFSADALRRVGMLYPGFFAYWEETDLCYRIFSMGLSLYCIPTAKIWHKISSSTGGVTESNYFRIRFLTRNRFLFVRRNGTAGEKALFLCYFFYWDAWRYLRHFVLGRNPGGLLAFLTGARAGIRAFKGSP